MSFSGIVFGASLSRSKNRVDSDYRVASNVDMGGHKVLHEDAVPFEGICCDRNIPPLVLRPYCEIVSEYAPTLHTVSVRHCMHCSRFLRESRFPGHLDR